MDVESVSGSDIFQLYTVSYANVAAAVLMTYEIFLTLEDEINLIWKKKFNLGSFLYLIARYGNLMTQMFGAIFAGGNFSLKCVLSFWKSSLTLKGDFIHLLFIRVLMNLDILAVTSAILGSIGIHALLWGRVYAISGGKPGVGIALSLILVADISMHIALMVFESAIDLTRPGIVIILIGLECIGGGISLLSDAAVMAITLCFAWRDYKNLQSLFGSKNISLTGIIVRQGNLRFGIIFIWGLEITVNQKVLPNTLAGVDLGLESSISTILVCRFLLELLKHNMPAQSVPSINIQFAPTSSGFRGRLQQLNQSFVEDLGACGKSVMYASEMDAEDNQTHLAAHSSDINTEHRVAGEQFPRVTTPAEDTVGNASGPLKNV